MEMFNSESKRKNCHLSNEKSFTLRILQSILPELKFNVDVIETLDKTFDLFLLTKKPTIDDHLPLFRLLVRAESEKLNLTLVSYHGNIVDETVVERVGENSTSIEALKAYVAKFDQCLRVCKGLPESGGTVSRLPLSGLLVERFFDRIIVRSRACKIAIWGRSSADICSECSKLKSIIQTQSQIERMKIEITEDHVELVGASYPDHDYGSDNSDWIPPSDETETKRRKTFKKSSKRKQKPKIAKKRLKKVDKQFDTDNSQDVVNVCKICGQSFSLVFSFLEHCEKCPEKASEDEMESEKKESIKNEIDQLSDQYSNECPICLKKFLKDGSLKKHLKIHQERLNSLNDSVICPLCSAVIKDKYSLNGHFISEHQTFGGCCVECLLVMQDRSELPLHFEKKHNYSQKKHLCSECGEKFKFPGDLRLHRATHHQDSHVTIADGQAVVCDQCGRVFAHRKRLMAHVRVFHNRSRIFACRHCDKIFYEKYRLVKHVRIHTGSKPYKCSQCEHRSNRADNVTLHLRKVHKFANPTIHDVVKLNIDSEGNNDESLDNMIADSPDDNQSILFNVVS